MKNWKKFLLLRFDSHIFRGNKKLFRVKENHFTRDMIEKKNSRGEFKYTSDLYWAYEFKIL